MPKEPVRTSHPSNSGKRQPHPRFADTLPRRWSDRLVQNEGFFPVIAGQLPFNNMPRMYGCGEARVILKFDAGLWAVEPIFEQLDRTNGTTRRYPCTRSWFALLRRDDAAENITLIVCRLIVARNEAWRGARSLHQTALRQVHTKVTRSTMVFARRTRGKIRASPELCWGSRTG